MPISPSLALPHLAEALGYFSCFLHLPLLLLFSGSLGMGFAAAAQQLPLHVLPCSCVHGSKVPKASSSLGVSEQYSP